MEHRRDEAVRTLRRTTIPITEIEAILHPEDVSRKAEEIWISGELGARKTVAAHKNPEIQLSVVTI